MLVPGYNSELPNGSWLKVTNWIKNYVWQSKHVWHQSSILGSQGTRRWQTKKTGMSCWFVVAWHNVNVILWDAYTVLLWAWSWCALCLSRTKSWRLVYSVSTGTHGMLWLPSPKDYNTELAGAASHAGWDCACIACRIESRQQKLSGMWWLAAWSSADVRICHATWGGLRTHCSMSVFVTSSLSVIVDQLMPALCDHWDGECLGNAANKYSVHREDWSLYWQAWQILETGFDYTCINRKM